MKSLLNPLFTAFGRLLVKQSVPFTDAADWLKLAYVRAASLGRVKQTDSQISIATGLQRRDIARLRKLTNDPAPTPNPLARIVAVWQSDPLYKGRDLPRTGEGSFDTLARSVRQDVHPRTFLDSLERAGTVQVDQDTVVLVMDAYRPKTGSEDQVTYLAMNVGDHLLAAQDNIAGGAFFERAVHYNGLTLDQVDQLHDAYAKAQMQVLKDINEMAAQFQAKAPTGADQRFRAGGYFWAQTDGEETE